MAHVRAASEAANADIRIRVISRRGCQERPPHGTAAPAPTPTTVPHL
ncbi:hypothetical protein PGH47_04105 [Streptomyces sp. HUAS 31]|nr:hypothetical protein [Streptomyces sp. HUAS 31]WCD94876.1 hypothetical protein PGH47_04105 [Streptomyces sp. HUAS 31]